MHWTWNNVIIILAGSVAIASCSFMLRYRERVYKIIVSQNTAMYGRKWGDRMRKTGSTWGVVIPCVWGIFLGIIFLVAGIFGHPVA